MTPCVSSPADGRRVRTRRRTGLGIRIAALALLFAIAGPPPAGAADDRIEELPDRWQTWLEETVYPLISEEQRDAFLRLETEAQRRELADRLWLLWEEEAGRGPGFEEAYRERLAIAREELGGTRTPRGRVMLLHGPPNARVPVRCEQVFHPMEFWYWEYLPGLGEGVTVLFYQPWGLGEFDLWDPISTRRALYISTAQSAMGRSRGLFDRVEDRCFDADKVLRLLGAAEYWMRDLKVKRGMYQWIRSDRDRGAESASARFLKFSTLVPDDAGGLDFSVEPKMLGSRGGMVTVGFALGLPGDGIATDEVGDMEIIQLDVVGEISAGDRMVDRFRYLFTVPSASATEGLMVDRAIRPGSYDVRVKIEDTHSGRAGVRELELEAILPEEPTDDATTDPVEPVELAAGPEPAAPAGPTPVLMVVGPEGEGLRGLQRFEAVASEDVARVAFLLDDEPVLTKNRPPFDVDVDLGPLPRLATVTAIAYDRAGAELDRAEVDLNVGRERFRVRLQPLTGADRRGRELFASVDVHTPGDDPLAALELYFNEMLLTTLYEEPFEAWLPVAGGGDSGYLRAVATLASGRTAEDIQLVDMPRFRSEIEVTSVELPVTVVDKQGRMVHGLGAGDFTVVEDGVEQEISHVSLHDELPVRLGLVIDTSGSMEETLNDVQRVVLGFVRDLLRPRDRAFVEAFSDSASLVQGFTDDFAALERALLALYPERDTALFDAVSFGLFQFSGMRGRKAMVVLTDGEDNASRLAYSDMLDHARAAGVTIYTIGLDLPMTEIKARSQLTQLARLTGGRAFFESRGADLGPIYERIDRELRSQYRIAYTSSSERPPAEWREVEVDVDRPGAKVRTVAGYLPAAR